MLKAMLSPLSDRVYAAMRILTGLMFSFHGMQKMFGVLTEHPRPAFPTQVWFGGVIELVGGLLIAAGFFTRCAAFVASGTMAVAYFQFHLLGALQKGGGAAAWLPGVNQGEMAVLYCWLFLFMACKGAGPWSIDAAREKPAS